MKTDAEKCHIFGRLADSSLNCHNFECNLSTVMNNDNIDSEMLYLFPDVHFIDLAKKDPKI